MKIEFIQVRTLTQSINPELIFSFKISEIEKETIPISFHGELFSESGFKLGDLKEVTFDNNYTNWINADGASKARRNQPFETILSCPLSDKAINHIENHRLNKKERTKDVVLTVKLSVQALEGNVEMAHLHFGEKVNVPNRGDAFSLYYQSDNNFSATRTNMWILSADDGSSFLGHKRYSITDISVRIDLMNWVNNFTEYLNIGNFIVYEFPQPDEIIFSKQLKTRYKKAQDALKEMRIQLNYGEWKMAIIVCRPIFELFKNFDDFRQFLLDNGYNENAYKELKGSVQSFFRLLSKFYHGLDENNVDTNPDISTNKEDGIYGLHVFHFTPASHLAKIKESLNPGSSLQAFAN